MEEERHTPEVLTPQEEQPSENDETAAKTEAEQTETEQTEAERTEAELQQAVFTKAGIAGDRYEGEIVPPKEEGADEFSDQESVDVWYDFTKEEIAQAMRIFQKQTLYKKNLLYTAIVLALFFIQFGQIVTGSTEKMSLVICVVCVAVLVMIWYLPLSHIRQVQKAMDTYETPPRFFMQIYRGAVRTGTGEQAVLFRFDSGEIRVFETNALFIVCYKNQSLFPIPKRCCLEQEESMRRCFQTLGKQYVRISS